MTKHWLQQQNPILRPEGILNTIIFTNLLDNIIILFFPSFYHFLYLVYSRWPLTLFHRLVSICETNAFIVKKETEPGLGHAEFRTQLIKEILELANSFEGHMPDVTVIEENDLHNRPVTPVIVSYFIYLYSVFCIVNVFFLPKNYM